MTFVYVIVCGKGDFVAEQAIISIHSLRMYNPDADIKIVTDRDSLNALTGERDRIRHYVDEFITTDIPREFNQKQKSRFLKTSLRRLIKGDFLYLDVDTVITDNLSEIEDFTSDVAIALNRHREWSIDDPHPMVYEYKKITGRDIANLENITNFFNTGVIFSRDTRRAHIFFDRWHQIWLRDLSELSFYKDQVAGWQANYELGNVVDTLDPEYNCMFVFPADALKYFDSAKILHYFGSTTLASCLKFIDPVFLKNIAKHGVTLEDERYIADVKNIFLDKLRQITNIVLRDYAFYNTVPSPGELAVRKMLRSHRWLNAVAGFLGVNPLMRLKSKITAFSKFSKSNDQSTRIDK